MGLALIQTNRHWCVRALGVALPVLMLLSIIMTANHYVLDAVIGGVLVLAALWAAWRFERLSLHTTFPRRGAHSS